MYTSMKKKDIILWCDLRSESTTNDKKRRSQVEHVEPPPSKRKLIEDKVDDMVEELRET